MKKSRRSNSWGKAVVQTHNEDSGSFGGNKRGTKTKQRLKLSASRLSTSSGRCSTSVGNYWQIGELGTTMLAWAHTRDHHPHLLLHGHREDNDDVGRAQVCTVFSSLTCDLKQETQRVLDPSHPVQQSMGVVSVYKPIDDSRWDHLEEPLDSEEEISEKNEFVCIGC